MAAVLSDRVFKNQWIADATCQMCFHISHGSLAKAIKFTTSTGKKNLNILKSRKTGMVTKRLA